MNQGNQQIGQTTKKQKVPKMSFKEAMERLTEITKIIEDGYCELEDMVSIYEEGEELVKILNGKLENAKMRIHKISNTNKEVNINEDIIQKG